MRDRHSSKGHIAFLQLLDSRYPKEDKIRSVLDVEGFFSKHLTACERGEADLPVMEHLYLSNPTDRNCKAIDSEWMFGDAFLVAPVLNEGGEREVYFPDGTWNHYFSEKTVEGRQYLPIKCRLDDMPLYVKSGSMIPTVSEQAYISDKKLPITLDIYYKRQGETVFSYYEEKKYFWKAVFEENRVLVDLGEFDRPISVRLIGNGQIQTVENVQKKYIFYI